jgi:hypothetical protein
MSVKNTTTIVYAVVSIGGCIERCEMCVVMLALCALIEYVRTVGHWMFCVVVRRECSDGRIDDVCVKNWPWVYIEDICTILT